MVERKRRRRRRPAAEPLTVDREAFLRDEKGTTALPPAPSFNADAKSATDAMMALDANQLDHENSQGKGSETASADAAAQASRGSSELAPSVKIEGGSGTSPAESPTRERPSATAPRASVFTAKKYRTLKRGEMAGQLAAKDEQIEKLEAKLSAVALARPILPAGTTPDDVVSLACEATLSLPFDLAAAITGVDAVRPLESRLKKTAALWAVALKPYLEEHAENLPLYAACAATLEMGTESYLALRKAKEITGPPKLVESNA